MNLTELRAKVAEAERDRSDVSLAKVDHVIAGAIASLGSRWVANHECWEMFIVNEVVRLLRLQETSP